MSFLDLINARKLATIGGAVAVSGTTEQALTAVDGALVLKGTLFSLEAVCTVAATTGGNWILRGSTGGTALIILHNGSAASAVGTRIVWNFPVPWNVDNVLGIFTVQPSVGTLGTWQFTVNGAMVP